MIISPLCMHINSTKGELKLYSECVTLKMTGYHVYVTVVILV